MKTAEVILVFASVIALMLNIMGIPGGNVLTLLALTMLSMLYFYFGFVLLNNIPLKGMFKKQSYKSISGLRIAGSVVAGLVLSVAVIGIEFKWMMWPGGSFMLLLSLLGFLLLAIITLIKYLKDKHIFYKQLLVRSVIMGSLVALLFAYPTTIRDIKYRNNPELLKALRASEQDPENKELQQKVNDEFEKIRVAEEGR